MNHSVLCRAASALLCITAVDSAFGQNDAVSFLPRAEVGMSAYSIDFNGVAPSPLGGTLEVNNKFDTNFASLKLGASAVWRRFYLDGYYALTTDDSTTQVFPELNNVALNWTVDREEYSVALGYAVTDTVSLFTGYRDSQSEGEGTSSSDLKLSADGYYLGASYRWKLTKTGSLNVSGAYAWLDADYSVTAFSVPLPDSSGDGDGVKVTVQWVDFFNDSTGYSVGADFFEYNHNLKNDTAGVDVKAEEQEAIVRIGLFHRL